MCGRKAATSFRFVADEAGTVCDRYIRRADKQCIAEAMTTGMPGFDIQPSYNIAPQTLQPVVRLNCVTGEREIVLMLWGLLPLWEADLKIGVPRINAKAESVSTAPAYSDSFARRRCLIPADAFYEWQTLGVKARQPYAIALKTGGIYAFAGIWDRWREPKSGRRLDTFAIITTDANEVVAPLHNRMPVIIGRTDYARWLRPSDPWGTPVDLLRPYPAEKMTAWKIGRGVINVKNDNSELLKPV
jgi:putative SOS response-associated peptidase YedK